MIQSFPFQCIILIVNNIFKLISIAMHPQYQVDVYKFPGEDVMVVHESSLEEDLSINPWATKNKINDIKNQTRRCKVVT